MRGRIVLAVGLHCLCLTLLIIAAPAAFSLPAGRHYEMVSPPFKAGYGVGTIEAAASTGESISYTSIGSFEGAPSSSVGKGSGSAYVATRTPSGWKTIPLMLPASLAPYFAPAIADFSSTFEQALFYGQLGPNTGSAQFESTEAEFLLHPIAEADVLANFSIAGQKAINTKLGQRLNYTSASSNLSHIILEVTSREQPLTEEANGTTMEKSQYDLVTNGAGEHTLRFIGVNNHTGTGGKPEPQSIAPNCNVQLGSILGGKKGTSFNAVSSNGDEIFFHTCAGPSSESEPLFVRLNGERTLEVSRPLGEKCTEVPCNGATTRASADFAGASEDGSHVFFTTKEHLVGTYTGSTEDLYIATIGCLASEPNCDAGHREVTGLQRIGSAVSESADVQGVVAVSPNGEHVYFVAKRVLTGAGASGTPVQGADNLYVYDTSSEAIAFVGDLCSENERSGEVVDAKCPADLSSHKPAVSDEELWSNVHPEVQVTHDGTFFVFDSYARLMADDHDNARDVYRYDAATGALERISIGESGYHENGNGQDEAGQGNADASIPFFPAVSEGRVASQHRLGTRAITEDGSRIVFATAEPLSQAASNGLLDAYEWHEGTVSLVSTGTDVQPVGQSERLMITPSGEDVFFITVEKLSERDTDEVLDLYDARIGPELPPESPPGESYCEGEECQPLSTLLPALVPGGTAVQAAGENHPSQVEKKVVPKKKKHKHKARRRHKHRGRRVKTTGQGGRR